MSFLNFSVSKVLAAGCMTALLGITAGCVSTPYYDGYGKNDDYRKYDIYGNTIYGDRDYDRNKDYKENFGHVSQELRARLERSGYKVMDVRKDKGNSNRILAHARRNNQTYEMLYTYPSLRHISTRAYERSNAKGNKHGNKHNGYKYKNKHD
ncbi:hypothetical protein [Psychrobacter aestuarii]|uniref:DUF4136 domain-containing protein n=1 Tax=Psychrobacter aestuarii TaxID=556327 RepID=A0ABN0VK16_9GAMM|nr:hypothetical protein [Psychrobacter aestuarii]